MTLRVNADAAADDLCFNFGREAALLQGGSHTFRLCYVVNTLDVERIQAFAGCSAVWHHSK